MPGCQYRKSAISSTGFPYLPANPFSTAHRTASTRLFTPNFSKTRPTCFSTVCSLRARKQAIPLLLIPSTINPSTSHSRSVSPPGRSPRTQAATLAATAGLKYASPASPPALPPVSPPAAHPSIRTPPLRPSASPDQALIRICAQRHHARPRAALRFTAFSTSLNSPLNIPPDLFRDLRRNNLGGKTERIQHPTDAGYLLPIAAQRKPEFIAIYAIAEIHCEHRAGVLRITHEGHSRIPAHPGIRLGESGPNRARWLFSLSPTIGSGPAQGGARYPHPVPIRVPRRSDAERGSHCSAIWYLLRFLHSTPGDIPGQSHR